MKFNKTLLQAALYSTVLGLAIPAAAQSDGPTPRVIVKWQKSPPAFGAAKPSPANALREVRSRHGVGMTSVRTTATGGEVFKVERPYLTSGEVAALIADLRNDPAVEYAEVDQLMQALATPADPLYSQQWHYYQGTSMAAPHIAGTAALMLARRPTLTPDRIEAILKTTARRFPVICTACGAGIVDAAAAVRTP